MIKGITLVSAVSSPEMFDQLNSLLSALGFEPGKGWQDAQGRGTAHIAPLGNLEFVTGRPPAVPPLLIEVTQLDQVHAAVQKWMLASYRSEEIESLLSAPEATHWNSRLFTVKLTTGEAEALTLGFWQSENPLHGKPLAIEGDLSAEGMRFAIVTARWNAVITDRLLQGALDGLHRSGAAKEGALTTSKLHGKAAMTPAWLRNNSPDLPGGESQSALSSAGLVSALQQKRTRG